MMEAQGEAWGEAVSLLISPTLHYKMVGLRGRCSLQGVFLRCKILSLTTSDSGTSCFLPAVVHPPKSSPPAGTDPRPPTMAHRRQGSGSHVPSEDRQPSFVGDHINDVVPQGHNGPKLPSESRFIHFLGRPISQVPGALCFKERRDFFMSFWWAKDYSILKRLSILSLFTVVLKTGLMQLQESIVKGFSLLSVVCRLQVLTEFSIRVEVSFPW